MQKLKHGAAPPGLALCVQGITEITNIWEELASLPFSKIPSNIADVAKGGWGSSSGFWIFF